MDIVLTPALKPAPLSRSAASSPAPTVEDIEGKLSAAESRRKAVEALKVESLASRLARLETVQAKKEEIVEEKSVKTKLDLEARLKSGEANRNAQLTETKEKVSEHLAKVEKTQKELEVQTEAARLSAEFSLHAKMMKAEENKGEQMEVVMKKIKEHEEYVNKVRANQENRLKPYLEELGVNIQEKMAVATKRREEAVAKVVEVAREDTNKIEEASTRRDEQKAALEAGLKEKLEKASERKAQVEEELKTKMEEREKKAELVRLNKTKLQAAGESTDTVPESA